MVMLLLETVASQYPIIRMLTTNEDEERIGKKKAPFKSRICAGLQSRRENYATIYGNSPVNR